MKKKNVRFHTGSKVLEINEKMIRIPGPKGEINLNSDSIIMILSESAEARFAAGKFINIIPSCRQ